MFNWIRRRKPVSTRRPKFRPTLEGLEDRQLLSSGQTAPIVAGIADQTLPTGGPIFVPVTASDGNNSLIGYTATSNDPNVSVSVRQGFAYLKVTVEGMGDMVFQLFSDIAPNTSAIISTLVGQGFYTNLTFHRVIPNFVIQGGDPNGDGTGGPGFQFNDEIGPLSVFNGNGQLAMANSGPNTNGSQFFVTIGPQTSLNGKYTIFGQLVRGFNVRDEIAALPTDPTTNKPTNPPVIQSAEIIPDYTDTVLLVQAPANYNGDPLITVTGANTSGSESQTFHVQVGNGGVALQNVQFVNRTFSTILNRPAEPAALNYFTSLLNNNQVSTQQIALQVQTSLEARETEVTSLYQTMLSRPAEAQALTYWTAYLNGGGSLAHVEATIAASQEYYQAQGDDNKDWINALFKAATGATSVPATYVSQISSMLNDGLFRQTYADSIFSSLGAAQFNVQGLYKTFLERTPGFSEYEPFAQALVNGTSQDLIVMDIVGSPEFFNFTKNQNNPTLTATTTTTTTSGSPSVFGQSVTFSAVVAASASSSGGTPTGTVTFTDTATGTTLGTGTLDSTGTATFSSTSLSVGSHNIQASYSGDTTFAASSGSTTQVVNQAQTQMTVAASVNPAAFGQSVTLTATIAAVAPGAGTATGSVTFTDETGTALGTVAVGSTGTATLAVSSFAVGSHTITAVYSGDTNFTTSTGNTPLTVNKSGTSTVIASSSNPANPGAPVTLTATVSAVAPGGGIPTGSVTYVDQSSGTTLGTANLDGNGNAVIVVSTLASGSHTIVASYSGDADFSTSLGSITQVIS